MKVVFPTCCGVDVHKTFLVATIITTPADSLQPHYQKKRFSTFNSDLNRFADWLLERDCLDVCMESTGKYWVPVFNILEKRGIRVVIANPKWVKAVKGNKDDTKDSKWIGDLFRIGLVKSSFIPNLDIRILREFTRYRYKLVSMKSSEKNRFQNAFTVCNVALDSVVSDMFGKSATAITDYLASDESFDADHCVSLLQRSLKKKAEQVLESIVGFSIADEQKARIKIIREHYDFIGMMIAIIGHIIKLPDCVQTGRCLRISNKFLFQQGVRNDGVGNRIGKTKVLTVLCSLFHHRFRQDFFGKGLWHFQPTFLCADDLVNAHGDLPAGDDVSPNIRIWASITHTLSLHLPHKAYRL